MDGYRELRRSRDDRMIGGVCAGLARYLGVDPTVVRVLAVVLTVVTGGGLALAYLVVWMIMPQESATGAWPSSPPGGYPTDTGYPPAGSTGPTEAGTAAGYPPPGGAQAPPMNPRSGPTPPLG
ncbi:MAG TPA: PspC domain-containing protein [Micromonosporaceae bacterium]